MVSSIIVALSVRFLQSMRCQPAQNCKGGVCVCVGEGGLKPGALASGCNQAQLGANSSASMMQEAHLLLSMLTLLCCVALVALPHACVALVATRPHSHGSSTHLDSTLSAGSVSDTSEISDISVSVGAETIPVLGRRSPAQAAQQGSMHASEASISASKHAAHALVHDDDTPSHANRESGSLRGLQQVLLP